MNTEYAIEEIVTDPRDIAYVRGNYATLPELCGLQRNVREDDVRALIAAGELPRATYVLKGGTEYFPREYFEQVVDRETFASRVRAAAESYGMTFDDATVDELHATLLEGTFGVCLKRALPEDIVRKQYLVAEIERLIAEPRPGEAAWLALLRQRVDALDELERPFATIDRLRSFAVDGTVSRDRLITAVRERYL
jgi:hypothetical protein